MCVRERSTSVTFALPFRPSLSPRRVASSRPPAPPPTTTMWCSPDIAPDAVEAAVGVRVNVSCMLSAFLLPDGRAAQTRASSWLLLPPSKLPAPHQPLCACDSQDRRDAL